MVFIDNLAYNLFGISFGGLLLAYTVTSMFFVYRNKRNDYIDRFSNAKVPLGIVGFYLFISGLWGQFTWPLPGSYNTLFYDPMIAFGSVMLALVFSAIYKVRLEYTGFLALMVGVMIMLYGIQSYGSGIVMPGALLYLYFLYGISGVLAYPVSLIADRLPGLRKNPWIGWHLCLGLFWLFMVAASLLAGYMAVMALPPGHLLGAI
jgi:putative membrane protein